MRISVEEAAKRGWVIPRSGGYDLNGPCRDSVRAMPQAPSTAISSANAAKRTALPSKGGSTSKHKKDAEGKEQVQLIKQFRAEFPDVGHLLIHIPNGGSRKNAFEGWRLKEQGVRAGVSDLFLPVPCGRFHGLWVEFKAAAPNTAAVSAAQMEWIVLMKQQGYDAHVCIGVDNAMQTLRTYLNGNAPNFNGFLK